MSHYDEAIKQLRATADSCKELADCMLAAIPMEIREKLAGKVAPSVVEYASDAVEAAYPEAPDSQVQYMTTVLTVMVAYGFCLEFAHVMQEADEAQRAMPEDLATLSDEEQVRKLLKEMGLDIDEE